MFSAFVRKGQANPRVTHSTTPFDISVSHLALRMGMAQYCLMAEIQISSVSREPEPREIAHSTPGPMSTNADF